MTEQQVELARRVAELEDQLARERRMQFELRRQLLVADESLAQLEAQRADLEASRASVLRLLTDATRISAESGDSDALWALIAQMSHLMSNGRPSRHSPTTTPRPEKTAAES